MLHLRIANWKTAFTDDVTGIHRTIDDLLWDYASFRTAIRIVNLANQRQRAQPSDTDKAPFNQMLFDLLAKGYWSSLLLGARRLLDPHHLNGSRGVYSLRAVLDDVKRCQPKLTRRVYVEQVRSCRYDLEELRQESWERVKAAAGKPVWGDPALTLSNYSHKNFDYLSGVPEADRSPHDLIDLAVFDVIERHLKELDRISEHASTHIAHAGNAESRQGKALEEFDIRDARAVLKALKEIVDVVGGWFANAGGADLATYNGDKFEALDSALIAATDIPELEANWNSIEGDIASWRLSPEELLAAKAP